MKSFSVPYFPVFGPEKALLDTFDEVRCCDPSFEL